MREAENGGGRGGGALPPCPFGEADLERARERLASIERQARRTEIPFPGWAGEGRSVWRTWGEGSPVVLLHGGTGSWTHWVRTLPALTSSHRVIVPDIPGMGDSDSPPPTPDVEELVRTLGRLVAGGLERLVAPGERPVLVGFSFGTMVGAHAALCLSRPPPAMVLLGPSGLGLAYPGPGRLAKPAPGLSPAAERAVHFHNMITILFGDRRRADAMALAAQLHNAARMRIRSHPSAATGILLEALPGLGERGVTLRVVWGEQDPFLPRDREGALALFRRFDPGARVDVVPGAGHWVAWEQAEPVNALIGEVLEGVSRRAGRGGGREPGTGRKRVRGPAAAPGGGREPPAAGAPGKGEVRAGAARSGADAEALPGRGWGK